MSGGATGIGDPTEKSEDANVKYYNLQGIEVKYPDKGIFIRKSGDKAEKVVIAVE